MLSITLPDSTEQNLRQLATLSGLQTEEVARVLIAIPLSMPTAATLSTEQHPHSKYRTAPDLTQEEFHALINSMGSRTPIGAPSLEGVDIRELAYED